ncbi:right-handed parallel beta-helix repeat-containing protein [Aquimarina intermedia]|uniref:Right handed beta helix region n=1 Tax=Aquimarina intermedia TaxID=350814 RepID=A0A5S5C9U0_9FLAO|nr:hypothetical protein [Aquimarina intermedia]TYP75100.1 Right handed beta helix region [Aquimarina intermedia]
MKLQPAYLILLLTAFVACQKTDISEKTKQEALVDESTIVHLRSTTPCTIDLETIPANSSYVVDCLLDLGGQTAHLAQNVNLDFGGGDIINGTVIYNGGTIDGKLLNLSLSIEGTVSLKSPGFDLVASRWDILEGTVTSNQALANRDNTEHVLKLVKQLQGDTLKINQLDAFFEISKHTEGPNFYASVEAINIPSGLTLSMTDQVHLRVFPNDRERCSLLAIRDASQVSILGGNLHGDRDTHDYSSGGTHEWGHLLELHAAVDVLVSGLKMYDATGDGMDIHSLNFTFSPDYKPSRNITVTNCLFDNSRRNNLSITDGYDMLIDGNTFLNAGKNTSLSQGTKPKYAIDVEAYRERSETTGELIFYEKAYNITISNNIEKGSAGRSFAVVIGDYVTIDNNLVENGIDYRYSIGSKIINNTITATPESSGSTGIGGGKPGNIVTSYNNEISRNTVSGFATGITLYGRQNRVFLNQILDFVDNGIFIPDETKDSNIYANTIRSTVAGSVGVFIHTASLKDVGIYNSTIETSSSAFIVVQVNSAVGEENNTFHITNNNTNSSNKSEISNSSGVIIDRNTMQSRIRSINLNKSKFLDNSITLSDTQAGLDFEGASTAITVYRNTIYSSNLNCIQIDSTNDPNEFDLIGNSCLN